MNAEIPMDLLLPTVEELENRTIHDLETEWKPCKRPGKRERMAIKKERDAEKLKSIAGEFSNPGQAAAGSLSLLFAKSEKPNFSLRDLNANPSVKSAQPTLRVSFDASPAPVKPDIPQSRKRGRPPKLNPL